MTMMSEMQKYTVLGAEEAVVPHPARSILDSLEAATKGDKEGLRVFGAISAATLAGTAIGALLWHDHRVLGGLAGMAVGPAAYALLKNDAGYAARTVATGAVGIGAALYAQSKGYRHWGWQAASYLGGTAAASVLCSIATGQTMNEAHDALTHKELAASAMSQPQPVLPGA